MDFFTEQDQARRSSKRLIVLFLLAVILLIALTNVLVAITLWIVDEQIAGNYLAYQQAINTLHYQPSQGLGEFFSWRRLVMISLAVCSVVGLAIVFKASQLAGGGKRLAEQLGGKRIQPNTTHSDEKQLLNVVEEMAIASGMPVPAVYLLHEESGINAFAAGLTTADAVIGITKGCLEQFNREQLQGVIAHEFSHILNGDMRLNIRLIAILHGIIFIGLIGETLLRSSRRSVYSGFGSRRKETNSIALLGFSLLAIGWLGRFFGNWIKSALSRQREFLADASAVQFTRNPKGISEALKIIGGYSLSAQVEASRASEMSHLFFGQAITAGARIFSTHPPLEQRISRIEPHWDGQFIFRTVKTDTANHQEQASTDKASSVMTAVAGSYILAGQGAVTAADSAAEQVLIEQVHEPFSAIAIIYAMLISDEKTIQDKQFEFIELVAIQGLVKQVNSYYPLVNSLDKSLRLPLIQRALPALKCMSDEQYRPFCNTLLLLIRADKRYDLFEWCLYQLLRHYLDPEFGRVNPSTAKYKNVSEVSQAFTVVLSMLCHYGSDNEQDCLSAFHRGANVAGLYTITLLEKQACSLAIFIESTNKLADCFPLIKPRLLKALSAAAQHDNHVSTIETEMITAIAAVMDSPVPPLNQ